MNDVMRITTRAECGAGHLWAPGSTPWLIGNPHDSIILLEGFTGPVTIDLDLRELGKCPTCGDAANAIRFEATPGEMV